MVGVVLVPGFGCSVICDPSKSKKNNSWLSIRGMAKTDQWIERNRVTYSDGRFKSKNNLGVWHGKDGVRDIIPDMDWIDDWVDFGQGYFGGLIDDLEHKTHVNGLPYDFRMILDPYTFKDFKNRFKEAVVHADGAVVVAHSLGAVLVRAALDDEAFCRKHVRAVIEVCPAHGGSINALEVMADGIFYLPVPSKEKRAKIADLARHNAGLILTLPNTRGFHAADKVWALRDGREIYPDKVPWEETDDAWTNLASPLMDGIKDIPSSVPHVVLYSASFETPVCIDRANKVVYSEGGDGVLHAASALCRLCDHTSVRYLNCMHRIAPSHDKTIETVEHYLW